MMIVVSLATTTTTTNREEERPSARENSPMINAMYCCIRDHLKTRGDREKAE